MFAGEALSKTGLQEEGKDGSGEIPQEKLTLHLGGKNILITQNRNTVP